MSAIRDANLSKRFLRFYGNEKYHPNDVQILKYDAEAVVVYFASIFSFSMNEESIFSPFIKRLWWCQKW